MEMNQTPRRIIMGKHGRLLIGRGLMVKNSIKCLYGFSEPN